MKSPFLTSKELAERWKISSETLRSWRFSALGPHYTQINGVIRYNLDVIEQFERERLRRHTADNVLVRGMEGKVTSR